MFWVGGAALPLITALLSTRQRPGSIPSAHAAAMPHGEDASNTVRQAKQSRAIHRQSLFFLTAKPVVNYPLTMNWANLAGGHPLDATNRGRTLDAGAVPLTRVSGLTAAAQSFHAHDRARRTSADQMSDVAAGGNGRAGGFALPTLGELGTMLRRGDIALAIGVMTILVVLILPLPATLLDMALAISIILSVLILMTSLFIQAPLEFSVFPDRAAHLHDAAAFAQPRIDATHPLAGP